MAKLAASSLSATEVSATNQTYVDGGTGVTFTPAASKTYVVTWTCLVQNNSTSNVANGRLIEGASTVRGGPQNYTAKEPTTPIDYRAMGGMYKFDSGASPSSMTFKIQVACGAASGQTVKGKQFSIVVLELGANDVYGESLSRTTDSSNSEQTKLTFNITPASLGDYYILSTATYDVATSTARLQMRTKVDGTEVFGTDEPRAPNSANRLPYLRAYIVSLSAASHTIELTFQSAGSIAAGVAEARILLLRKSDLTAGWESSYVYDDNTQATYQDVTSIVQTTAAADHVFIGMGQIVDSSTTVSSFGQYTEDAVSICEMVYEGCAAGDQQYAFTIQVRTLTAASHTYKAQRKSETTAASTGFDVALMLLQVPPATTGPTSAVGAAAGVGAATGVGASTKGAAGAAPGVGAAAGVGASIVAAVGAAAGIGAASGAGQSTAAAVATSAGTGAAQAVGVTIQQAIGTGAGVGAGAGTGASVAAAAGAATGVATAPGVGASTAAAVAAAAGVGAASAAGAATSSSTGTSAGAATAAATGASTAAAAGSSAGVGAGTAVGASTAEAVGSAAGVSTAEAFASGSIASGAAAGVSTATGVGASIAAAVGVAAGAGAAGAAGATTSAGTGVAAGAAGATTEGSSIASAVGVAAGTSDATAESPGITVRSGAGAAAGVASAAAVGIAVVEAVGVSAGAAVVSAIGASTAAAAGSAAGLGDGTAAATAIASATGIAAGFGLAVGVGSIVVPPRTVNMLTVPAADRILAVPATAGRRLNVRSSGRILNVP